MNSSEYRDNVLEERIKKIAQQHPTVDPELIRATAEANIAAHNYCTTAIGLAPTEPRERELSGRAV